MGGDHDAPSLPLSSVPDYNPKILDGSTATGPGRTNFQLKWHKTTLHWKHFFKPKTKILHKTREQTNKRSLAFIFHSHKAYGEFKRYSNFWAWGLKTRDSSQENERDFSFTPRNPKTLMGLLCFQLVVYLGRCFSYLSLLFLCWIFFCPWLKQKLLFFFFWARIRIFWRKSNVIQSTL